MLSCPSSSDPPSLGYLPLPEAEETVPKREEKWPISSVVKEEMGGKMEGSLRPKTGPAPSILSKSILPCSSGYLPLPEKDETILKREEKWVDTSAISKKASSVARHSPSTLAAPTLLNDLPAEPSSTQPSASKTESLSVSQCSPMLKTAPMLSNPMPTVPLHPLGFQPLLEGDKTAFKTEERQLVESAVSKSTMSVLRHSPMLRTVPALPKAKHASVTQAAHSVLCGNKPKPASFMQATPFILHGMETKAASTTVPNGDRPKPARLPQALSLTCCRVKPPIPADAKGKYIEAARGQPRAPRPSAAFGQRCWSSPSMSLKVDAARRLVSTYIVSKDTTSGGQHTLRARTALTLSRPLPAHPSTVVSCPVLMRIGPERQNVKIVNKDSGTDLPVL
jgi:hypothetical protein